MGKGEGAYCVGDCVLGALCCVKLLSVPEALGLTFTWI